mmetsp:Transcript_8094/g.21554  ORF Transcript_8094/g.21554 Transcript_8094/m.21554 type:complete len:346 (+) Transcript_8094:953-1990(+)
MVSGSSSCFNKSATCSGKPESPAPSVNSRIRSANIMWFGCFKRKVRSAGVSCWIMLSSTSVAFSLVDSLPTLRMRVTCSNSPNWTSLLNSCCLLACCKCLARLQNSCKNATRSAHSGSLLLAASSDKNSCFKKLGSAANALTTSTLLNRVRLDRVAYVASSSVLGRMTSLMYCVRYVWWILARMVGSLMGTTSLKATLVLRNWRCGWGLLSSGSYSKAPTMSITYWSLSSSSNTAASLSMMAPLTAPYMCASVAESSRSSACLNTSMSLGIQLGFSSVGTRRSRWKGDALLSTLEISSIVLSSGHGSSSPFSSTKRYSPLGWLSCLSSLGPSELLFCTSACTWTI